jgi:hypothetical protein
MRTVDATGNFIAFHDFAFSLGLAKDVVSPAWGKGLIARFVESFFILNTEQIEDHGGPQEMHRGCAVGNWRSKRRCWCSTRNCRDLRA